MAAHTQCGSGSGSQGPTTSSGDHHHVTWIRGRLLYWWAGPSPQWSRSHPVTSHRPPNRRVADVVESTSRDGQSCSSSGLNLDYWILDITNLNNCLNLINRISINHTDSDSGVLRIRRAVSLLVRARKLPPPARCSPRRLPHARR